jgi:hypothetical protein
MKTGIEGRAGETQILLKSLMGELKKVDPQTPKEQIMQDDVLLILTKVRSGIIERKPEVILSFTELESKEECPSEKEEIVMEGENSLQKSTVIIETAKVEIKVSPDNQNKTILTAEKSCAHFWDIEVPNGPSSKGVCKHCGEKKEFLNAFPTFNPLRKKSITLDIPEPEAELEDLDLSR